MIEKTFVDTNILIYAHDRDASRKRAIASEVLRDLWDQQSGVLSTQVLQEFYVNVTRKMSVPLPKSTAQVIAERYAEWCIETGPADVLRAFRIEEESKIGFWDALIVASAVKSGATRILSEDLNAGQRIAGILIENPFATP